MVLHLVEQELLVKEILVAEAVEHLTKLVLEVAVQEQQVRMVVLLMHLH